MLEAEKLGKIQATVIAEGLLFTRHARREAVEEGISPLEVREAIMNGTILEDYPNDRRGPSCLLYGRSAAGRDLHIVVTTEKIPPRVITVYEPKPPRWLTPTRRRSR